MLNQDKIIRIDPLSRISLHIEVYFNAQSLGNATGFMCERGGTYYLITNWHVLSGLNPETKNSLSENGAIPNKIKIWHHVKGKLGTWVPKEENLLVGGKTIWKEHPLGGSIDVVALPITAYKDIDFYPLDLQLAQTDLIISPSEPVSIIGFPRGIAAAGKFPIWKTAHIASDLDLDCDGKPIFVVDTTTKPGMSGSPVLARRIGFARTSRGFVGGGGDLVRFLGIYSGRIDDDGVGDKDLYNLGRVWKSDVLNQILI
jgi:hypothetical protein